MKLTPAAVRGFVFATAVLLFTVGAQIPYWAQPTLYRSEARFLLSANLEGLDSDRLRSRTLDGLEDKSILATFASILEEAGHLPDVEPLPQDAAAFTLRAARADEANVVALVVEGPDPTRAAEIARAAAESAMPYFRARHTLYHVDLIRPPSIGRRVGLSRAHASAVALGVGILAGLVVIGLWPRRNGEQSHAAESAASLD